MSSERTKGRLTLNGEKEFFTPETMVGGAFNVADARHLVACWNAAEDLGVTTELLEAGVLVEMRDILKLLSIQSCMTHTELARCRAVLSKLKGT